MKNTVVIIFSVTSLLLNAQPRNRIGISAFFVEEKNSLNIGFSSFDIHALLLKKETISADHGLRFIGATTGKRGGYFAFGYFTEVLAGKNTLLRPGLNTAFLAGGGAASPDYDGWMIQGTLFLQSEFNNGMAVRAGLNYAYVSRGVISGFSPLLGLNWQLVTRGHALSSGSAFVWQSVYAEAGAAIFNNRILGLTGTGARATFARSFNCDVMIHAITNAHGGYMQSLVSGGPFLSTGPLTISPSLILGLGGGGGVPTVGGALYGAQLALNLSGENFTGGIKYQWLQAYSNRFDYRGIFLSLGKMLSAEHSDVKWDLISKTYITRDGFSNIGARITGFSYRGLRLMGSTHWAFTHNKGAYAEGLFEASISAPSPLPFYLIVSAGAGGGSGINQRKAALIYGAGAGLASPFKTFPVSLELSRWQGGNVPQWSLALIYSWGSSKPASLKITDDK